MREHPKTGRLITLGAALTLAAATASLVGCVAIGAIASSYEATGSHDVQTKYEGLSGKSFAVVVAAHPVIQTDFPDVVPYVTTRVSERLSQNTSASGWVPPQRIAEFQYSRPSWSAMAPDELAKELGVDRLVMVDLQEYRLNEPGNQYLWGGLATANISVYESDSIAPDQPTYTDQVQVRFPDTEGAGPMNIPAQTVHAALSKRFVDRISWLFYTHEEPNRIEY